MEKIRRTHGRIYLEELEKSQWYTDMELRALQEEKLLALISHAYDKSAFYRRIFDERKIKPGDVKRIENLQQLPIITKKELCKYFGDVVSDDMGDRVYRKVSTGGSTGEPLPYLLENSAISMAWACNWRAWRWAGWDFGDKMATLAGASLFISRVEDWTGRLKKWAYLKFLQRNQPLSAFDMSNNTIKEYAVKIQKNRPEYLRGYASALTEFARWCSINKSSIHFKGIFSTAESLFAEQRSILERTFNCRVFDHYGANDGGGIAHECERHEGLHWASENSILEIVDDEGSPLPPGEEGRIIVTGLNNYVFPFIRYEVGDSGKLSKDKCACGRGLPLLEKIHGRIQSMVVAPDGKKIHGEFFSHIIWDLPWVKQYQVVQKAMDKLIIRLVPDKYPPDKDIAWLKEVIMARTGKEMQIEVSLEKEIPTTSGGKRQFVISEVVTKGR